jgi:uncharacterized membrane protein YkvA (DUF1232 family)
VNDSIRPDDVITPDRGSSLQLRRLVKDTALFLPQMIKLVAGLVRDPRVPRRSKLVAAAALAYVVSPVDLLPELIPVVGLADDVLVVAFALNHLMSVAGDEVIAEYWDGPRDLLDLTRSLLDVASDLVPARVRKLFGGLSGR